MELGEGVAVIVSTIVTVLPCRVAKKVVQPEGQAVSVSTRVDIAVTVTGDSVVGDTADCILTDAAFVEVVHEEVAVAELGLLLERDDALLARPEDAGT